ncbi:Nucleotide-binding universal stress protein, UspA family [Haloplanus vescus]|uniref:Nucleotide-binding universal stress protein, UspA family n=1 Tax=Haloplanus vescus TaxID=555874 RepID=A0A1H3VQ93_9EURY|nr:universal stress protein [Haloplanus vescus]SDZ76272.1 Nucleotide-binding universal stress protein, UspA family [Haloplanus vescus]
MYESILVPVDGSEPSDAAVEHACSIAGGDDATVHLVHAVEHPDRGMMGGRVPETIIDELWQEGEDVVEAAAETVRDAGLHAETVVVEGSAPEEIGDYAETHDVDLVVMGTHGRSGLERYLLGSTTERTIRTVHRPMLTVESPP